MKHASPPGSHELYMLYCKFIKGCACRRAILAGGKLVWGLRDSPDVAFCVSVLCMQDGQDIRAIYFWKMLFFFLNRNSAHVTICI